MRLLKQSLYYLKNKTVLLISQIMILFINAYRYLLSPILPNSCRYYPTCSEYALIAIKRHGPISGGLLAAKRILHCHPWSASGYDPVPENKTKAPCEHSHGDLPKGL